MDWNRSSAARALRQAQAVATCARRVGCGAGKKDKARAFETIFFECANKCRLPAHFGEDAGHHTFIEKHDVARGKIAIFENLFQFLAEQRGSACDGDARRATFSGHRLCVPRSHAMADGADDVKNDALKHVDRG